MKNIAVFINLIIFLLLIVLSYAVLIKMLDFQRWVEVPNSLDFVNVHRLYWIDYFIPIVESITLVALIFEFSLKLGAYLYFFLMCIYTCYVYYKLYVSLDGDCSCGGIFSQLTMTHHLWLNLSLVFLSAILIILNYKVSNKALKNG